MCEELVEKIYHIAETCETDRVSIFTNHLKFSGALCEFKECKIENNNGILTLKDVKMWRIKDICTCGCKECKCNENNFDFVGWVNINLSKIIAFTIDSKS